MFAAFILTLRRERIAYGLVGSLFGIGTILSVGAFVWSWGVTIWIAYSLSDSGSANTAALAVLPIPIGALGYALTAIILLWPGIPQSKAMHLGKILHLIFLPLLVSMIFALAFIRVNRSVSPELKWLVYGLLWFRIREKYNVRNVM